jgi:hypothetical protein
MRLSTTRTVMTVACYSLVQYILHVSSSEILHISGRRTYASGDVRSNGFSLHLVRYSSGDGAVYIMTTFLYRRLESDG